MTLTPERMRAALGERPFRYFEQTASTNDDALAWAQDGAPAGAVVVADFQTRGRGRQGHAWVAQPGTALMLSLILRPKPDELSRLTMLGALAICETLEALGLREVEIKWPNDVRVRGRKVSGVLPEAAWSGEHLTGAALGIGLNVHVDFSGSPLAATATSLEPELGRTIDHIDLLVRLLGALDGWTGRLGSAALYEAWRARLSTPGRQVRIDGAGGVVEGVAERVDDQGALLVRTSDGTLRRVVAGDMTFERES